MQQRLNELHLQRGRLQERIAHQRQTLVEQTAPLQALLARGERLAQSGRDGIAWVKAHPLSLTALALLVVILRPRAALRWIGQGYGLWRTWKSVRRWIPGFAIDWIRRRF